MKYIIAAVRIFVGLLFIISGYIKLNDPVVLVQIGGIFQSGGVGPAFFNALCLGDFHRCGRCGGTVGRNATIGL